MKARTQAIVVLSVMGWCYMVSGLVFAVPYFIKSKKEKVNGTAITVIGMLCQCFFCFDVISVMMLTFKEKRWEKLTIALLIMATLITLGAIGWIIFQILFG